MLYTRYVAGLRHSRNPLTDPLISHVIGHCCQSNGAGAGHSTINHDVSYLSSVMSSAKLVYGIDYTSKPVNR